MAYHRSKFFAFVLFQIWEVLAFVAAFFAGLFALENAGALDLSTYAHWFFIASFALLAFLWNQLLSGFDLYLSRRLIKRQNETAGLIVAVVAAAGFLSLLGALLGQPLNQPEFLVWFMLTALVLLVPGRVVSRLILRTARHYGRNLRFVAIAGSGAEARSLAKHIQDNPHMGYRLRGLFDTDVMLSNLPPHLPEGGTLEDLAQVLTREPVDEVLIALPLSSRASEAKSVLHLAQRTGTSARLMSSLFDASGTTKPQVELIGTRACLHYDAVPNWGWQGYAKRLIDVVGAGLGLIILSPILIGVALAIRLDSKGSPIFAQTRVGKNRQHFKFYKFRTMVQNAESMQGKLEAKNEAGGPNFKIQHDPRITRLGHILRKYSIDELPQLWNVVKGDMSLVGPRPLPLRDVARFEHDWHSRRFSVRPGLTCSWVLKGRSQLEFDAWVRADLDYIDNWSLMRDVSICLRTIPVVVKGSGAY